MHYQVRTFHTETKAPIEHYAGPSYRVALHIATREREKQRPVQILEDGRPLVFTGKTK